MAKLKKAPFDSAQGLRHPGTELRVCYEAGPTGFVLARRLGQLKTACLVVAPSLIPTRSGERIKTDRRAALSRAERDRPRAEPRPEGRQRRLPSTRGRPALSWRGGSGR